MDVSGMDSRIRLRPWLESRLNEGWIPGLIWVDKEKAIFKIPWKHHSKHTWSEEDALIFKDWAVVTGRYREGIDTPDWPMWKTRLRCALNKAPDIQEVKQRHNLHCDDPFKVYRFISKTESLWRANASRNASMVFDGVPSSGTLITSAPPMLIRRSFGDQAKMNNPTIFIRRTNTGSFKPITVVQRVQDQDMYMKQSQSLSMPYNMDQDTASPSFHNLDIGATQEIAGFMSNGVVSTGNGTSSGTQFFNQQQQQQQQQPQRLFTLVQNASGGATGGLPQGGIRRPSISLPNYGAVGGQPGVQQTPIGNQGGGMVPFLPDIMEPELHQLCLRIQHLDIRIKDTVITSPNGCCIYYGRYDESDSPTAPEPIEPPIPQFVSDKNKPYVDLLLDNMQRGVIITVSHGSVYAERLCKCAIFVYVPISDDEFRFTRKLSRREREKIFDYDQFLEDVDAYKVGLRSKPSYEIVLAFGQQLKPGVTTDGLLVWCRLANCKAWFIMQRVQSTMQPGASTPMIRMVPSIVPKAELLEDGVVQEEEVIEEGVEEPLDMDNAVYDSLDSVNDYPS